VYDDVWCGPVQAQDGRTPFLSAVYHGQLENAEVLLCAGADLHAVDGHGKDCRQIAAARGHDDVLVMLVSSCQGRTAVTSHLLTCYTTSTSASDRTLQLVGVPSRRLELQVPAVSGFDLAAMR
jgi:hypothetical protein